MPEVHLVLRGQGSPRLHQTLLRFLLRSAGNMDHSSGSERFSTFPAVMQPLILVGEVLKIIHLREIDPVTLQDQF